MVEESSQEDRIVDAALEMAAERGWSRVHLHEIAAGLDVSLAEINACFAEKDDIGNAVLARGDAAMLMAADIEGYRDLPPPERLEAAMMAWFKVLTPHKRAVRAILGYKLRLAHVHLMEALVVRLSRTVQWLREVTLLGATGRRQQMEEVGLSVLFCSTVICWLGESGSADERTRNFLRRGLARSDRLMGRIWPTN